MKNIEVVAAVIVHNNKIFATQRGYGDYKGFWEFPGGKIEQGETKQSALKREIKEELDIDITVNKLIKTVEYDYPTFHLTMHVFSCFLKNKQPTLLEHMDAKWLSKNELAVLNWLPADMCLLNVVQSLI